MNVVVVNAYHRHNAGDAALLDAGLAQIELAFPAAQLSYCGLEDAAEHPSFRTAQGLGSVRRWAGQEDIPRVRRMLRKAAALSLLLMPAVMLRALGSRSTSRRSEPSRELHAIASADLVVGLGGGYLNGAESFAGTLNVLFLVLPLVIAARLHKPIALAPQSYGPFRTRTQRRVVRAVLNRMPVIVVREDQSLQALIQVGVEPQRLVRGVDSAFFAPPTTTMARTDGVNRPTRVGLTARDWLTGVAGEKYEAALAEFIDWLQDEREAEVTLIPQVTADYGGDDDRRISRRIADRCRVRPQQLDERLSFDVLRETYGSLDVLVGTRFHSVIFGLTAGIPAIAIEYEHKTSGIMGDLGLSEWVIPIADVTAERLRALYIDLEASRSGYLSQLGSSLPSYQRDAGSFVDVMQNAVGGVPSELAA